MEGGPSRLTALFLPKETRRRLRQQRLDEEAARDSIPWIPRVDVTVTELQPGGEPARRQLAVRPANHFIRQAPLWFARGRLSWNGEVLTVVGATGVRSWPCRAGGIEPGFAADEVAEAGIRPITSGDCSPEVVELAGIALKDTFTRYPMRRLYLLDAESRHLTVVPFLGLPEEEIRKLAELAGIPFRRYSLAHTAPTDKLCEALFPPSALAWRAVPQHSKYLHWWDPGYPPAQ